MNENDEASADGKIIILSHNLQCNIKRILQINIYLHINLNLCHSNMVFSALDDHFCFVVRNFSCERNQKKIRLFQQKNVPFQEP